MHAPMPKSPAKERPDAATLDAAEGRLDEVNAKLQELYKEHAELLSTLAEGGRKVARATAPSRRRS